MTDLPNVDYVNLSTNLPVDETLYKLLLDTLQPNFIDTLNAHQDKIDVFFVSAKELDREINQKKKRRNSLLREYSEDKNEDHKSKETYYNPDFLGLYFPFHHRYQRSVILVSPEKILGSIVVLTNKKNKKGILNLKLIDFYPALLTSVVIHELVHWIMDEHYYFPKNSKPWSFLMHNLDENFDASGHLLKGNLSTKKPSADTFLSTSVSEKFVEESLANAVMLTQKWNSEIQDAIINFVKKSPPEYKASLKWNLDKNDILKAAEAWRDYKRDITMDGDNNAYASKLPSCADSPFNELTKKLKDGKDEITEIPVFL